MPENCSPSDCPVNARMDALEKEFNRYRENSSETHRQMFERIGTLEQNGAVVREKLDSIDKKLDKLVSWREEQDDKPNKLLDKLKESGIWMVVAAVIGMLLGRVGL